MKGLNPDSYIFIIMIPESSNTRNGHHFGTVCAVKQGAVITNVDG